MTDFGSAVQRQKNLFNVYQPLKDPSLARLFKGGSKRNILHSSHLSTICFTHDRIATCPNSLGNTLRVPRDQITIRRNFLWHASPASHELIMANAHVSQVYRAQLTCELCHGHGYEQTEDGKEECSVCNADGEGLREHITADEREAAGR